MSILERIQLLSKEHNISIPKLEKELGLGNGSIYTWVKSSPKVSSLQKVADYFNVTIDSLITDKVITPDSNDCLTPEIIDVLTDPKLKSYILLTKKAADKGLPPEVLETLIDLYTKKDS